MTTTPTRMPALFIGHGSPTNANERNRHTLAWQEAGRHLPRPRAILAISAHWYRSGIAVTAMPAPRTTHDFNGFPPALYEIQYRAPGDPGLAAQVAALLAPSQVRLDQDWGLDHGSWSVLAHLFPDADVPVVQLSLDARLAAPDHYSLARRLAPLRDEGVLILGSGNLVHNLRTLRWAQDAAPYDWAVRFNDWARSCLLSGDHESLADPFRFGEDARLAIPTPEHYLPLLYTIAQQHQTDAVSLLTDGIVLGSIGMLAFAVGSA